MADKQVNLFLIWTEYHLFTSITAIVNHYSDDGLFENVLLHPSKPGKSRILNNTLSGLNATLERIECDDFELKVYPDLKSRLNDLLRKNIKLFVTFFEMKPINFFLVNKLSGRARICLAPDGNKPYLSWSKMPLLYYIKKTIKMNLYLMVNRLWVNKIYQMSMVYGSLREVDEIWLTVPEYYKNTTGKELRKIKILDSKKSRDVLNDFFDYDFKSLEIDESDVIFYCNNIYYNNRAYEVEIEVLKSIRSSFPDRELIIKLHPLTPDYQLALFHQIPNTRVLEIKVPAELIISNLRNSLILSFWSAALMIDNPKCAFYWMHPLMRSRGALEKNFQVVNPTKHINVVERLDEIELPK